MSSIIERYCLCGHKRSVHDYPYAAACAECWNTDLRFSIRVKQATHNFRLDNLRYLEALSEQSSRG